MISRFSVRNFKSLLSVDLELTPFHALIGPNDSGKSSILQALAALSRSVDFPFAESFLGPWFGRQLVWHGEPLRNVSLAASIVSGNKNVDYSIAVGFHPDDREPKSAGESIKVDGTAVDLSKYVGQPFSVVHLLHKNGKLGKLASESGRDAVDPVYEALSGVQLCHWNAGFLAAPAAPDSSRRLRLDPSGFGLPLTLDDILGYDRARFAAIEEKFIQIFPAIRSVKLIPEAAYRAPLDSNRSVPLLEMAEGKGLYFEFDGNDELVPASQVSDGVLIILAYLTVANLPKPPRLILVEEPENGIHPKRLEHLLRILRELTVGADAPQVILTTHSPYVLDLMKPDEVTLCRRAVDGSVTTARLAESAVVRRQIDIFGLGEIWTSEGDEGLAQPTNGADLNKPEAFAPETEPAT